MNITLTTMSDLHGRYPKIENQSDLVIIAGDLFGPRDTLLQMKEMGTKFVPWLNMISGIVVIIGGNHDQLIYRHRQQFEQELPSHVVYLEDELFEWKGLRIWGSPWTRTFGNWFFMLDEPELKKKWEMIPPVDILITHGPPFGVLDKSQGLLLGSPSLKHEVLRRIKPKWHIFGHIHDSRGVMTLGDIRFINTSLTDDSYTEQWKPYYGELEIND